MITYMVTLFFMLLKHQMSCNLGKTGTSFTVNSQVFVILYFGFWSNISSSQQEQKMHGTCGMQFPKVFIGVL